jgi:hypothetical protein
MSFRKRQAGPQQPDISYGRKCRLGNAKRGPSNPTSATGENRPLPSRNSCPGSGRRKCSGSAKKQHIIPPKPEGPFWQAAYGDLGHSRRPHPRAAESRSRLAPGPGPTRVRDAAGGRPWGKGHRRRSVPEEDYAHRGAKGAKRGSCGIPGSVGSGGRGQHEQCGPPLFIIPLAPRSGHRFRAGTIAFSPLSLHRDSSIARGLPASVWGAQSLPNTSGQAS